MSYYPNCKDSTSTYYEGITTLQPVTEEEQAETERREQPEAKESYYKNEAKKNRRIAEYSLDADNKRTYSHRAEVFEQKAQNAEKALANLGESGIIKSKRKFEPLPSEKEVPIIREDSKEWVKNLSSEETRSIKKYTKSLGDAKDDKFYARLNAMLRGEIPEDDTLKYYSNQISSAISKFELKHDIVCYRTLDYNAYKSIDIGKFFKEPQFTSTSVVKSKVLNKPFLVKINVSQKANGAYIETISEFPKQREFLIDKNTVFKVISKTKNSIELEMIV